MTSDETHRAADADDEPRSELAVLVRAKLGRRVRDLRVEYDGRGLVLRGRAESYYAKQLAQHVAMAAVGLPLSANKIVVTYLRGESPRPGGEDVPAPMPASHTAEPGPHRTRGTPTPDSDATALDDGRFTGESV